MTPEGILLVDPISADFARWLKSEFATRFPGKPVRYIIYSHSHWDHVGGAAVFADSHPHIVGQERILKNMDGRYPHMPGNMIDRNHNGTIESEEIAIPTLEHPGICGMGRGYFESVDRDHTGHLTAAQWWAAQEVVPPDIVYSDRMTLVFGGRTIQLVFPGLNHADDGTVVYFPMERVVFSADFPADALVTTSMRSLPSGCGMFDQHPLAEWIKSYRTIEGLDFDILAQGHGSVTFTKADVSEGRQYFEDLRAAVAQGMAQGRSLAELKKSADARKIPGLGLLRHAAGSEHRGGLSESRELSVKPSFRTLLASVAMLPAGWVAADEMPHASPVRGGHQGLHQADGHRQQMVVHLETRGSWRATPPPKQRRSAVRAGG